MKHTVIVTILFLLLFIVAQIVGLVLIGASIPEEAPPPPEGVQWSSIIYIIIGVAIGTVVLLFLAKKKSVIIWKIWFFIAVWLAMGIALGVIFDSYAVWIPVLLALGLTVWKVYFQNIYIHNFTEILMYAGIAVLFVPWLNIITALVILVLFSFYDIYAVWKSKHMIKMAEFATDANLFPGLTISYSTKNKKTKIHQSLKSSKEEKVPKAPKARTGVLGGGDIVFPLLFTGAVFLDLVQKQGFMISEAFWFSMIIVLGSAASLLFLFLYAKKGKFYPAMPYLTVGSVIGFGLMLLVI